MSHKNCLERLKNRRFFFVLITSFLTLLFTFLLSDSIYAQASNRISLQGKIVRNDTGYEGLNVVNGTPSCVAASTDTCNFKVSYYNASTGGTLYYSESFSGVEIGDYGGVFNLKLGSGTAVPGGSLASTAEVLGTYKDVYMEIAFDPAGGTTYGEVFTRTAMSASAYAMGAGADSFSFYNTNDAGESSLTATAGAVYYNSTESKLKVYNGTTWDAIGGGGLWVEENISSWTEKAFLGEGTEGLAQNLSTFSLDSDEGRATINTSARRGGLSVYSAYTGTDAWSLVSIKGEKSTFNGTLLSLTQDGTGDLIRGHYQSSPDSNFRVDKFGGLHLALDGIAYFDKFVSLPVSGSLYPNSNEGCLYSVGSNLYWDPSCDASTPIVLGSGSTLWTDSGTFTYLTSTTDDLVLGASATSGSSFFFDVSTKRLGIGTDTPQASIDIAGATSTISNDSGDITITPADDLIISGANVGIGTTVPSAALHILTSAVQDGHLILKSSSAPDIATASHIGSGNLPDGSIFTANNYNDLNSPTHLYYGFDNTLTTRFGITRLDLWQITNIFDENANIFFDTGYVGIGTDTPSSRLSVVGGDNVVQLSVKGYSTQSSNIVEVKKSDNSNLLTLSNNGLLTLMGNLQGGANNSYDIGSTSTRWKNIYSQGILQLGANEDSGSVRYNTTNDELEFSNDGSTWIPMGSASKTTTLSSEYAGAVLAADGTDNIGFMTSDAEGTTSNSMNYYEWNSSETSLQDYDVRLRFTIPSDFASWATNAFTLYFATEAAASTNNKVDIYVYEESSGTVDDSSVNQYSSVAGVWQTTNIQGADLGECNAAGKTCLILIRMYSANDNYVRVGDIDVNYNRKL